LKRVLSVLLCLAIGLGCMTVASAAIPADEVNGSPPQTRMAYINKTQTLISISGGKAICVGTLTGYQGITTKVEITLTLQRRPDSSSTWTDYVINPKQTFNSYKGTDSLTKDVVKGYQYRTKAVYTAYSGANYETLTEYSSAVSY